MSRYRQPNTRQIAIVLCSPKFQYGGGQVALTCNDTNKYDRPMSTIMIHDDQHNEHPLSDVEVIRVDPDDVIDARRRNKRDEDEQRSHVLRVSPPFDGEVKATSHVNEAYRRYPPEVSPKPYHIDPRSFEAGFSNVQHPDAHYRPYPDISETRHVYRDTVPEDERDEETWDEFWDEALEMWEREARHGLVEELTFVEGGGTTVAVKYDD